jgi:hypothetical protein
LRRRGLNFPFTLLPFFPFPFKNASDSEHFFLIFFTIAIAQYRGNQGILTIFGAANFNKKGARKTKLPNGAWRWNKGTEFIMERVQNVT